MESCSRFTCIEGGARLAVAARTCNTLAALQPEHASFVAYELIHEEAFQIRGSLYDGFQRSVYVTRASRVKCIAYDLRILTELTVCSAVEYSDVYDWYAELDKKVVLVCTSEVLLKLLQEDVISLSKINVLVLDSCHLISNDESLQYIMKLYKDTEEDEKPRILALTYPLFTSNRKIETKKEEIEEVSIDENPVVVNDVCETKIEQVNPLASDSDSIPVENSDKSCDDEKTDDKPIEVEAEKFGEYENMDDFELYEKLEWKIEELERELFCRADLAEDIDNAKRMTATVAKPKELIVEYNDRSDPQSLPESFDELEKFMRDTVSDALQFLQEHRYDPTEIYGEDLYEELKSIPNPAVDPVHILHQFLYILDELGPYGADKAAFSLLTKLEKLKIKVPYERHFLLMCLCTSVLIRIRCAADHVFQKSECDWLKIQNYCSPKITRLAEILEKFKPNDKIANDKIVNDKIESSQVKILDAKKMMTELDQCDFAALSNKLEDKVNTYKSDLSEIHDDKMETTESQSHDLKHHTVKGVLGFPRRMGHRARGRGRIPRHNAARILQMQQNPDSLCGIVYFKEPLMAKIIFMIIVELSRHHPNLGFLCAQYSAIEKPADPIKEPREYEQQRKKQEEVLKKFRMHECNLLLATSCLEEGIDLPRCNLVLRWDMPPSYRSYGLCLCRARAPRSACVVLSNAHSDSTKKLLHNVATYRQLEQIVSRKCGCGVQNEPPQHEEDYADQFTSVVKSYTPLSPNICDNLNNPSKATSDCDLASVDLSTAIALINRYCGKLPSDTFTRLAPQWWTEEVELPVHGHPVIKKKAYICTLRLPLNCPVKYNIVGHPMPTRVLARRMVALLACRILHKSGELDNQLMPIGKENFKAPEFEYAPAPPGDSCPYTSQTIDINDIARPGTTKRRQYYYKRTAWSFTDCQPIQDTLDSEIDSSAGDSRKLSIGGDVETCQTAGGKYNMLYAIVSKLWCALPERYNTRGRRLHAPQTARQGLAILTSRQIEKIPAFPVYTRSGEVRVSIERVHDADVRMSPRRGKLVRRFMRFVFADVLRVRRRGMRLQTEGSTHNNYYIVPTFKALRDDGSSKIDIDWPFLELIYRHTEKKHCDIEKPLWNHEEDEEECKCDATNENADEKETVDGNSSGDDTKKMANPLLKAGESFVFNAEKYREAVVTPWYRNQDQPQFFLVAEICWNLSPDSAFPSATHTTFRHYYTRKYGVELTQADQPLLDVDHTSARLNLLTPRYVNRKGVALPVSSERTRRAKRDRLDQKQILVPELCRVHPFAAPLWFATVALPCVLYRINALLIADEIRRSVAIDVGLGIPKIGDTTCPGYEWPPLDFGWILADVLNVNEADEKNRKECEEVIQREERERELKEKEDKEKREMERRAEEQKTLNDILQEKEDAESGFEIGMWSNDMASSVPQSDYDEYMEPLPSNLTFCTTASGGTNWSDPVKSTGRFNPTRTFSVADSDCSYMSSDFDTDDSDLNSVGSDEDTDTSGFSSSKNSNAAMGVRIEYKTAHEAEAVDLRPEKKLPLAPQPDPEDDAKDKIVADEYLRNGNAPDDHIFRFRESVAEHKRSIIDRGLLIRENEKIVDVLPELIRETKKEIKPKTVFLKETCEEIFPYETEGFDYLENGQVTIENIEKGKRILLERLKKDSNPEEIKKLNCFSMIDVDIDSPSYVNEKIVNVGFDSKDIYVNMLNDKSNSAEVSETRKLEFGRKKDFDFDYQPSLEGHPGPSPSVILQALTMSNANDGINLERLETIGDSFLKFAITAYLYCAHPTVHEGKLSHMRSKQVSNLNLYRLGRGRSLGARMIASKFEPHDNWLPPCHRPPATLGPRTQNVDSVYKNCLLHYPGLAGKQDKCNCTDGVTDSSGCFIPYNLITQHSIPDKSVADCVEALIGAYLIECGPRGALLFMSWLGIKVLPRHEVILPPDHPYVKAMKEAEPNAEQRKKDEPETQPRVEFRQRCELDPDSDCSSDDDGQEHVQDQESEDRAEELEDWSWKARPIGTLRPYKNTQGQWIQPVFGELKAPPSPLLRYIENPEGELEQMLSGYETLEETLRYRFRDRSLLLQALTHASHQHNRLTDCYQRLEFLGDAILDYLITRHLYEDERRHSPGALTDLRSALVNNTIFATLAVRHGFHKYFRHMSPGLNEVLTRYVKIQEENGHSISEEHYLIQEDELEQAEDVEVPKALGDLFESVAGAIFLDSGMSLGAVWKSYVNLMGAELEAFSAAAPKSPVRELLEAEPDTAKFGKPERLADGRRVRVCVEVFGRGAFKGVGRNYRIAKGTAARCALRHLKKAHRI